MLSRSLMPLPSKKAPMSSDPKLGKGEKRKAEEQGEREPAARQSLC